MYSPLCRCRQLGTFSIRTFGKGRRRRSSIVSRIRLDRPPANPWVRPACERSVHGKPAVRRSDVGEMLASTSSVRLISETRGTPENLCLSTVVASGSHSQKSEVRCPLRWSPSSKPPMPPKMAVISNDLGMRSPASSSKRWIVARPPTKLESFRCTMPSEQAASSASFMGEHFTFGADSTQSPNDKRLMLPNSDACGSDTGICLSKISIRCADTASDWCGVAKSWLLQLIEIHSCLHHYVVSLQQCTVQTFWQERFPFRPVAPARVLPMGIAGNTTRDRTDTPRWPAGAPCSTC